jgi:hypothetical protein
MAIQPASMSTRGKEQTPIQLLVISGSMGSGKTTIMAEASDILSASGVHHAAIDLDVLGIAHLPDTHTDLTYRNLESVWTNYSAAGIRHLLVASAVENRDTLDRIRAAVPGCELVVCRLRAHVDTMRNRVAVRDPGMLQNQLIARVTELEQLLDAARLEDFTLVNDSGSVTDTAREMLRRAGWL